MKRLYSILFLSLFSGHIIAENNDNERRFVKDHYPSAQKWFNHITNKYPKAKLDIVDFCIGDTFCSDYDTIYWPKESLERISATSDYAILNQEEYILLHESAHIVYQDVKKRHRFFLPIPILGQIIMTPFIRNQEQRADDFANKIGDINTLAGGIQWYSFLEEKQNKDAPIYMQSLYSFYSDPHHPKLSTRISKIKKALRKRFGTDIATYQCQ